MPLVLWEAWPKYLLQVLRVSLRSSYIKKKKKKKKSYKFGFYCKVYVYFNIKIFKITFDPPCATCFTLAKSFNFSASFLCCEIWIFRAHVLL